MHPAVIYRMTWFSRDAFEEPDPGTLPLTKEDALTLSQFESCVFSGRACPNARRINLHAGQDATLECTLNPGRETTTNEASACTAWATLSSPKSS